MISTPMFMFGAPMYYGYPGGYSTVSTQIYNNDNGRIVRNFFTKDNGFYMPSYYGYFRAIPRNLAYYYGNGGGGSSRVTAKTSPAYAKTESKTETEANTETETESKTQSQKTDSDKPKTVTNPAKTAKPDASAVQTPSLGRSFVDIARKYSGCSESNGTHHKFCINPTCKEEDPYDQEWCTDFVTYVVKEAYKKSGRALPKGFGDHDVETMKNWAIDNDMFINTANRSARGRYIVQNIKPGDIFIMNENGSSHTGFVTRIDKSTGVIHTIEGNRDDKVKEYQYSPNNPDLSGFIRLKP